MERINLCGKWRMQGNGYDCYGTVPGSVYSFLLGNKLISDPYTEESWDFARDLLRHDYTFSRSFECKKTSEKIMLACKGLDTICEVKINGMFVAKTMDMHRSYEFDITSFLTDGENEISIAFFSPILYFEKTDKEAPLFASYVAILGYSHLRKSLCMSGWDWGPELPDAGIWRDIYIFDGSVPRFTDTDIIQRFENDRVFITPVAVGAGEIRVTFTSPEGEKTLLNANEEYEVPTPKLWYPNGYGEHPLYTVEFELVQGEKICDSAKKRIGLRKMELVREKDKWGESFYHRVNGIDIFAMGADYVPEDNILSRLSRERSEKLLDIAVESNFNTIRVWGGGNYPEEWFFDLCDEKGLLVFMDMMFACMLFWSNPEFMKESTLEVRENLIRFRHHACLALISGNNECEEAHIWVRNPPEAEKQAYLQFFEDILPETIKEVCPYLPYIPSSPTTCGHFIDPENEDYGDGHYWAPWHRSLPPHEYEKHCFRYLSEFGYQSLPDAKTLNVFLKDDQKNLFSPVMERRQRCGGGNRKIINGITNLYRLPSDFGTLVYASQITQAEYMRRAILHMRANRGRCMGVLYWQLNDIWPGQSWSSVDYFNRYKALQYEAKRLYAPQCVTLENGEFIAFNESNCDFEGKLVYCLRDNTGKIIASREIEFTIPPRSAKKIGKCELVPENETREYISFVLLENIYSSTEIFVRPSEFEFIAPEFSVTQNGDSITVSSKSYARFVEIYSETDDFVLSDNFFDLNGDSKTVKVLRGNAKNLSVRSVIDIK